MELARATKERFEAARWKLDFQAKDAWFEYYYIHRAIAATREHLNLVGFIERTISTGYSAGTAAYNDIIRAQIELKKLQERRDGLIDLTQPVAAKLNAALNRPVSSGFSPPEQIEPPSADISEEQLLTAFTENNPEFRALAYQAQSEKWNIDLAKKTTILT